MLYTQLKREYKSGDSIWACAYEYNGTKECKLYFQEPVFGMLSNGNNSYWHEESMRKGRATPSYFVPYKKNSTEPAWSKAVSISARIFAKTREECVELFNSIIRDNIRWHEEEIRNLQSALLVEDYER